MLNSAVFNNNQVDHETKYDPIQVDNGTAKILSIKGVLYLENNLGRREIGQSNSKSRLVIDLACDPVVVQDDVIDLATSCLTPKTKSSSPSMMLHQCAAISLMKVYIGKAIHELESTYTPDIFDPEKKYYIDITGINVKEKIDKMPSHTINFAINKYKLLSCNNKYKTLFMLSESNDAHDISYMYSLIKKQANHVNKELLYTPDELEFFIKKKDKLNRTIEDHVYALEEAISLRMNSMKYEESKDDRRYQMSRLLKKLDEMHNEKIENRENKYYIFPNVYVDSPPVEKYGIEYEYLLDCGIMRHKQLFLNKDKLYVFIQGYKVKVHEKTYLSAINYTTDKVDKNADRVAKVNDLLNTFGADNTYRMLTLNKCVKKLKAKIDNQSAFLIPSYILYRPTTHLTPCSIDESTIPKITVKSHLVSNISIDPDHLMLLQSNDSSYLVQFFETLRDYHELRFRARVATACMAVKKSDKVFIVNHWFDNTKHAECVIKGRLFDRDSGMMIVSYINDDVLYRTEKWRLSDLENYSVAHHRLISLASCLVKNKCNKNSIQMMIRFYARILSENSWGLSKFLKPLRYLCTGILVNSPMIKEQVDKCLESLNEIKFKLSLSYFRGALITRLKSSSKFETPIFDLNWSNIGWEIFIVNLCPSNTYGHDKHLKDICKELYDEVELYDNNIDSAALIFSDFYKILRNKTSLVKQYMQHLKLIDNIAEITKDRFTFSPASVILCYREISTLKIRYSSMQENLQHISELMTAKASFDTYGKGNCMALQSIERLSQIYQTSSTSMLAAKILNKQGVPDLTMWLFDKDQVGGNREISVLTAEFRILQAVSERFMYGISKYLDNEFLNRSDKESEYTRRFETNINNLNPIFLTADQTRWGPNFNTCTFGFLSLLFAQSTTEYYLPAIINFISEFKIFEIPAEHHIFHNKINAWYSLPGIVARSHMGQGIFHINSSVYHSLCIKSILSIKKKTFFKMHPNIHNFIVYSSSLVTSDDLCVMESMQYLGLDEERHLRKTGVKNFSEDLSDLSLLFKNYTRGIFSNLQKVIRYYGIKTSSYKNWISDDKCEFNSIFLSKDGIGSNDIKFVYSLIDPATTGDFFQDYRNALDSYYLASNSNCNARTLMPIVHGNFLKFARHWKLRVNITGLPSLQSVKEGLMPWTTNKDDICPTSTKSTLHFKTRDIPNSIEIRYGSNLDRTLIQNRFSDIQGTRERQSYRSCMTYSKIDYFATISPYFRLFDAVGESYEHYVQQCNLDISHSTAILKEGERPFLSVVVEKETSGRLFDCVVTRRCIETSDNMFELIMAINEYPRFINYTSNNDQILLHMLRKYKKIELLDDTRDLHKLSLADQMIKIKEENEDKMTKGGSKLLMFNKENKTIRYFQTQICPPILQNSTQNNIFVAHYYDIPYSLEYSKTTAYVAKIFKTENGFCSQDRLNGYRTCIYGSYSNYTVTSPTIEEIGLHLTSKIQTLESAYCKNMDIFLNIKITKKYEEIKNFRDEEDKAIDPNGLDRLKDIFSTLEMGELNFDDFILEDDDVDHQAEDEVLDYNINESKDDDDNEIKENIIDPLDAIKKSGIDLSMHSVTNTNFVSVKVSEDAFCYSRRYYTKRAFLCWCLNVLLHQGVILGDMRDGYFYDMIDSLDLITTDTNLSYKINDFMNRYLSSQYNKFNEESWERLAHALIHEDEIYNTHLIHVSPLFNVSQKYSISQDPLGEIIEKQDAIKYLNL